MVQNLFTLGRSLDSSTTLPHLSISRKHCVFNKNSNNEWVLEDHSAIGVKVNGEKVGKGKSKILSHNDLIQLECSETFIYQFINEDDDFVVPRKRIKLEMQDVDSEDDFITNVKIKFEESQQYELQHIEEKLISTKHLQTSSAVLKDQLQLNMDRRLEQLTSKFAAQIEDLKGKKNDVEKQKAVLLLERDTQLATIKEKMEEEINKLMEDIKKHNETESELLEQNNKLKQKLDKDKEEFLVELNKENSSKQEMLEKLEAKIKEQEEVRLKEKKELEERLQKETEQLMLAKEKELKELEEQKLLREKELEAELDCIKKSLKEQVQETQQQRAKVEQQLNEQMEQMKKLSDQDKAKMEQLESERQEIQKKLNEAQIDAEKSLLELQNRVAARETELATLAADRIQQQVEQSTVVITSLQEQLEKVKSQLLSVESEKNTLLENIVDPGEQSTSKQSTLAQVGDLMESELQCSICAEMFVEAISLACSHTFCKYCISMWKKKKKDCPICRAPITSECRCLILDSYIDKMVQNLTEELKTKRREMLKSREEMQRTLEQNVNARTTRRSSSSEWTGYDESDLEGYEDYSGQEEEDDFADPDDVSNDSDNDSYDFDPEPDPNPNIDFDPGSESYVEYDSDLDSDVESPTADSAETNTGNIRQYGNARTAASLVTTNHNINSTNVTYTQPSYVTTVIDNSATVNTANVIPVYTITVDNTLVHTENIQISPDGDNIIEVVEVSGNRNRNAVGNRIPDISHTEVVEIVDTTILDDNNTLN